MAFGQEFVDALAEQLRGYSAGLLDRGKDSAGAARASLPGLPASLQYLLGVVTHLERLMAPLLDESRRSESGSDTELVCSRVPRRAVASRAPQDWQKWGELAAPTVWLRPEPVVESDPQALGWLQHVIAYLDARIADRAKRILRQLDEVIAEHEGSTFWGQERRTRLLAVRSGISQGRARLARCAAFVNREAGTRVQPCAAMPRPFPRGLAWQRLRRLDRESRDNRSRSVDAAVALLAGEQDFADLPTLYQRWCGFRLVAELQDLGFAASRDADMALYLGGRINFDRDGTRITLWCEPPLSSLQDHDSGLKCRAEFAEPDYVLVTPGPHGMDAFVLDPTLGCSAENLQKKGSYLDRLEFHRMQMIAGVPTRRAPLRAWAIAPLRRSTCDVFRPDGAVGVIPMQPAGTNSALRAWLDDVCRYALAWSYASQWQ